MHRYDIIKQSYRLTLPLFFTYIPLGLLFGVLFAHSGFAWYFAPIMSLLVFGGSVQFVALSLMTKMASVYAIVLATIFLAFRNSFYGLGLLQRYKTHWLIKSFLIFMLVDPTYVILVTNPPEAGRDDIAFCFWVSLWIYAYWTLGTFLGALFSKWIPPFDALSFILPAFFMVLAVDYFIAKRKWHVVVMPIVCAVVAYLLLPKQYLLLAIVFSLISILTIKKMEGKAYG